MASFFEELLGLFLPSNFVFYRIILMFVKLLSMACDMSKLTDKVEQLAQEFAIHEKENEDKGM
ncbi:DUF2304 domain-containing protein [Atopobium sp. oral taxon 416]|uniref:DUF2304 domain-containing protein n=1 Tax=Atopobium sp. oral taxon 416 TaxID=712157 RepID=UPI0021131498|nr:DUF2304 domain-containing protein [Atopobium sp. oral taxon 416]